MCVECKENQEVAEAFLSHTQTKESDDATLRNYYVSFS